MSVPSFRCRLARLLSIQTWRFSSQSSMASTSLPATGPSPSRAPRLLVAVSGDSTLETTAASASWRSRLRVR